MSENIRKRGSSSPLDVATCRDLFELPPLPPYIDKERHEFLKNSDPLTQFLTQLKAVPIEGERDSYRLEPQAYYTTIKRLQQLDTDLWGYVVDKIRFDLIKGRLLILRMPNTIVHEVVSNRIRAAIEGGLQVIRQHSQAATLKLVNDVKSLGSADVRFTEGWSRSPDQQFQLAALGFPGVIIEVAYSQPDKKVARAAKDYILETNGEVQMVIVVKVDHDSPCIKLTTWRPKFETENGSEYVGYRKPIDDILLSDEQGNTLSGSLLLQLRDFGPQAELDRFYPTADLEQGFDIQYKDIIEYVREAKRLHEAVQQRRNQQRQTKRRRRSESSVEEINSSDEKEYQRSEERAERATSEGDADYKI